MKLQTSDLKTARQWRAATGFDQARFAQLLVLFTASYLELFGHSVAVRQIGLAVRPSLTSEEELLYFTLFSLKSGLTYDLLGVVCGMDGANANRNQALGIQVLEQTLAAADCLPKREFKDAAEFAAYLKNEEELIFDGIAQRTQRPSNDKAQKENYTGKQKCHTVNSLVLSNPQKEILYLSHCWVGKTQDYAMFKVEFPPALNWFKDHRVRVDLGFVGIKKDYQDFKELFIPHKKKKQQELSAEQKETNKLLAGERVVVEHASGGLKRYRILSDRLRMRNVELYNVTLGVCAGLWNFYLTY